MIRALLWVLVTCGPFIGAAAGGAVVYFATRAHWRKVARVDAAVAYADGANAARRRFWAMVPEMVFTPDGRLEPDLEGWEPWTEVHQRCDAAMDAVGAQHQAARTSLNLP